MSFTVIQLCFSTKFEASSEVIYFISEGKRKGKRNEKETYFYIPLKSLHLIKKKYILSAFTRILIDLF